MSRRKRIGLAVVAAVSLLLYGVRQGVFDDLLWSWSLLGTDQPAWVVHLYRDHDQQCTGAIVGNDTIVTAAHCLGGGPEETIASFYVMPRRNKTVVQCHRSPDFEGERRLDIALCDTHQDLAIPPARLGDRLLAAGTAVRYYGRTAVMDEAGVVSDVLADEGMLITGKNVESWDSGGPVAVGGIVYGVISGPGRGGPVAWPSGASETATFLDMVPGLKSRVCFEGSTGSVCDP